MATDANPTSGPWVPPHRPQNIEILGAQSLEEKEYRVDYRKRGKAVIFNHFSFDDNYVKTRCGSENDVHSLEEELTALGFDVDVQVDKTVTEVQEKLHDVAIDDHSEADCLVIVVMSHGGKSELQGHSDEQFSYQEIAARDDYYYEKKLFEHFERQKSKSLAGKPKIFFIQACRVGEDESRDEELPYHLKPRGDIAGPPEPTTQAEAMYYLPKSADFLVFRSTVDETYSERNEQTGAYFIQALCQELRKNRLRNENALDLESLLIDVKREFLAWRRNTSQMPCVHSTLIRKLYLKPKRIDKY